MATDRLAPLILMLVSIFQYRELTWRLEGKSLLGIFPLTQLNDPILKFSGTEAGRKGLFMIQITPVKYNGVGGWWWWWGDTVNLSF